MVDEVTAGRSKLADALTALNTEYIKSVESLTVCHACYSEKHLRFIRRLISRQKRQYWKFINTAGKRVACAAVLAAVLFAVSMNISATRIPILNFYTRLCGNYIELFLGDRKPEGSPDYIKTVYGIGYIPEGYKMTDSAVKKRGAYEIWTDENGDIVIFQQFCEGVNMAVNNKGIELEYMTVGNKEVIYGYKHNNGMCFWNDSGYILSFRYPREIEMDEIIKMIESIKIKEERQS